MFDTEAKRTKPTGAQALTRDSPSIEVTSREIKHFKGMLTLSS